MERPSFTPPLAAPQLPPSLAEAFADDDPGSSSCNVGAISSCGHPTTVSSTGPPSTPPLKAHIAVHVQTSAGAPVSGVFVTADDLGPGITDTKGNWDFGEVAPGSYTVKGIKDGYVPDVASQTQQAAAGVTTPYVLKLDPVEFHLHVDADRDGKVDTDRTGIDKWEWGKGKKGAVVFCNNDDDEGAGACDNADSKVNAGNDGTELAPIELRRTGPPPSAGWQGFLEAALGQEEFFHLFESNSPGSPVVLGKEKGNSFRLPDLSFTTKKLWIEATKYADGTFSGEFVLTFRLVRSSGTTLTEQARFRVAPWIMPNHLSPAEKVFVVQTSSVPTPAGVTDNSRFRSELNTFASGAGCTLQPRTQDDDVWIQDCMEFGYSNLPGRGFRAVMRSPRNRPLKTFPKTLLKADLGYQEQGTLATPPNENSSFNSTGNLECTPPVTSAGGKKYPFGRIYFGPGGRMVSGVADKLDEDEKAFLKKQIVQEPIEIDTNWLLVGHVDEIISFVPAPGSKGFKLLLASPKLGFKILNDNKAKHGSEKIFVGRQFPDFNPDGSLAGWNSAEVPIADFLNIGLTGVKFNLTESHLTTYNDSLQAKLDATRAQFKTELGLSEADIIDVPSLFADITFAGFADALTAGMVNMLVVNKHCLVAKPFGPVVGGNDLFAKDLEGKLKALGLSVTFIDDWYEYHVQLGEVHCATNTLRSPTEAKWWEFTP